MTTQTQDIQMVESEQESVELFKEYLDAQTKPVTKAQAIAYAEALRAARTSKDFTSIRKVWLGLPRGNFSHRDWEGIIKPVVNEDMKLVEELLAKLAKAHGPYEFRKLHKLPRPVVPAAFRLWKTEAIKISLTVFNKKYKKDGDKLTNAIAIA